MSRHVCPVNEMPCPRCDRAAEDRADPAISRSDEEFAVRQAERKYERQLFGRSA